MAASNVYATLNAAGVAHHSAGRHYLYLTGQRALADNKPRPQADATRLARSVQMAAEALTGKALGQVDGGHWAMPDRREGEHLAFAIASTSRAGLVPPIVRHLQRAKAAGDRLGDRVVRPDTVRAGAPTVAALQLLRASNASAPVGLARTLHPSDPIRPARRPEAPSL